MMYQHLPTLRSAGLVEEREGTGENEVGDNLEQTLSSSTSVVAFAGCCSCLLCEALPPELRTRPSGMCYSQGLMSCPQV